MTEERPPLPYGRQTIDDDDLAAVEAVLRSDFLTTGPEVARFEVALARVLGHSDVAVVSSGTAALHAIYAAAGVGQGRSILTSPLTFAATATAALHLGADVLFADVEDKTLCLDPVAVAERITRSTAAIVPVDYAGHPAPLAELREIAEPREALLIEDAAHALGARYRGRPVGAVADATVFSFHPVKTVTTAEGGAVSGRADLVEAVRRFRNHGLVREPGLLASPDEGPWHQEVQTLGLNYRMPDVLAALGRSQLAKLDAFVARRAALVSAYMSELADHPDVRLPVVATGVDPAWHLFPIRVPASQRRAVVEGLRARGILVQVHYLPVHLQPLMRERGGAPGQFPVAEQAYRELVSLPLFPGMTDEDQRRVLEALDEVLPR